MNTKQLGMQAAVMLAMAIPAAAVGQLAGTSHPDEVPVATSPDGVQQPLVYVPTPPSAAASIGLKPRAGTPVDAPANAFAPSTPALRTPVPAAPAAEYNPNEYRAYVPLHPIAPKAFNPDASIAGDAVPVSDGDSDLDRGIVTRVAGPTNRLPEGTLIRTKTLDSLSTKQTEEGSEWRAELVSPVMRDGRVLLPAGAVLHGRVTEVHGGRRISGRALLHLETIAVTMPDGNSIGVHAQVIDTNLNGSTKVDQEGTILHRDHRVEQASVLALTTGSGAAAGALIGGVPGALIGAGVGAGVSTAIWLKQDRQTELPRNTQITFELTRALSIGNE